MKPAPNAEHVAAGPHMQPGPHLVQVWLVGLGTWGLMLISSPSAALATAGFTGGFTPDTWIVVNTYTQPTPPVTLTGVDDSSFSTVCQPSGSPGTPGPNQVACINSYVEGGGETPGSLTLFGGQSGSTGGGEIDNPSTTTFTLTNPYPSNYEYRRVYLLSFNWSFTGASLGIGLETQYLRIRVLEGSVITQGQENFEFNSTPGLSYDDPQQAYAYLPMGAKLEFTIFTENTNSDEKSILALTGFEYVEIPAPLPISGACMFFASSRRLRGRLRKSSQNFANSNSAGTPGSFTHPGASCSSALPAAIHRYSARLGLPLPDGQGPLPLRATSLHASRQHPSDRPAAIGTAFNQPLQSASM